MGRRKKKENDVEHYFKFDGKLIEDKTWSCLSFPAQAVFPVIACHCNLIGEAFPAEKRIGDLAGLREKTVRKGIKNLEAFKILTVKSYVTTRGHTGKRFHVSLPMGSTNFQRSETKAPFPFHKSIIDGCLGCWKDLTSTAKAVYPVMRYFAFPDEKYSKEEYLNRNFDCCDAEPKFLAEYAGISPRILKSAINSLADNDLIEEIEESNGSSWHVYFRPNPPF